MNLKMNKYNSKLRDIENAKEHVRRHQVYVDKYEYELYGSKDSMFYGLKYPTLFKICEYLCDQYKIPYDLMMDKIYHMIMKQQYEDSFRFIDYNKRLLYDSWDTRIEFIRNKNDNEHRYFQGLKKLDKSSLKYNKYDLYIGSIPYKSDKVAWGVNREDKYLHRSLYSQISCKSIKELSRITGFNPDYLKYLGQKKISKADIIKELNILDIKYRSNMKCNELMTLLMKGK